MLEVWGKGSCASSRLAGAFFCSQATNIPQAAAPPAVASGGKCVSVDGASHGGLGRRPDGRRVCMMDCCLSVGGGWEVGLDVSKEK